MGVKKQDYVRNMDTEKHLRPERDTVTRIQNKWLWYFGHVERMEPHRLLYQALYARIHGM